LPFTSSPLGGREAAEIENSKFKSSFPNKCLTMVVFPDPDGAENTINFPFFILMSLRGTKQSHPLFVFILATNCTNLHELKCVFVFY
jgi:hypothetical protein